MGKIEGRSRRRIPKQDLMKMWIAVAAVLAVVAVLAFFLHRLDISRTAPPQNPGAMLPTMGQGRATLQVGKDTYTLKDNVESYLFLGIDVAGPVKPNAGNLGAGQADTQMLLVIDRDASTWQLLQINRDTMTQVTILGVLGEEVGTEYQQIALAHSYGDGMKKSCRNAAKAVSELLGGCPIEGYYSLHMEGVSALVDAVGGVTMTIPEDYTALDPALKKGAEVTLTGEQAYILLRSRKDVDDMTNVSRMARQRAFLEAAVTKAGTLTDADVLRTYEAVSDYVVTDLGSAEIQKLSEDIQSMEQLPTLTIDGKSKVVDGVMTYELDQTSLRDVVVQLFYEKS